MLIIRFLHCVVDIHVMLGGHVINNNSLMYFDEIDKQDSTSALVCYTNNFNVSCETNNSQGYGTVNWYFPHGEPIPQHTATQTSSTLFTQRGVGWMELHRLGHPSQAGRYFCTAPNSDRFYVNISKKRLI